MPKEKIINSTRHMDLATDMQISANRIGYPDEGLRLKFYIGTVHNASCEFKLSRRDVEWLRDRLTMELNDPRNDNMPRGTIQESKSTEKAL